jgi:hypothetical protein
VRLFSQQLSKATIVEYYLKYNAFIVRQER